MYLAFPEDFSSVLKHKNRHALTLSELSITLKHSGRHMALSRLVTLSLSVHFVIWILRLINSMMELNDLPCVTLKLLFDHI